MKRSPIAGGCFLVVPILLGFAIGIATGDAMRGVILGTAAGILAALAVWLVDARRS